ncbi:MAG: hypothetical protein JW896_01760 [Deltaproteobacteria bacterium]|nr:hypothetical protein [Deltaproteobacteria bacterium]
MNRKFRSIIIVISMSLSLLTGLSRFSQSAAAGWEKQTAPSNTAEMFGVWGSSGRDVFAVQEGTFMQKLHI